MTVSVSKDTYYNKGNFVRVCTMILKNRNTLLYITNYDLGVGDSKEFVYLR